MKAVLSTNRLCEYVGEFNQNDSELDESSIANDRAARFLAANVPLFDCPDEQLVKTYYFRWWTFRKHIRHTPDGYVVTEFLPRVEWSGRHNTINCAVGHHLYEGRWLRNRCYLDDYVRFVFLKGGDPGGTSKHYSNWITDGIYSRCLVSGDRGFAVDLLDELVANFEAWNQDGAVGEKWQRSRRLDCGLYWQVDSWEGQEFSIGGTGARVPINAYRFGDAMAISRIADWADRRDLCERYRGSAEELRELVLDRLWNPETAFFEVLRHEDATTDEYTNDAAASCESGRLVGVRELFGYTPWYFGLPADGRGYEEAWRQLTDPMGFAGRYGPTVAERRHPGFEINRTGCRWSGASWPFSTSQTLTALANLLNDYNQNVVSRHDYFYLLMRYARSHSILDDARRAHPWIDESLDPDTGRWITNGGAYPATRGRYYNHSTFCDLFISGLIGLRPSDGNVLIVNPLVPTDVWDYFCLDNVSYHGHRVTVLWDKTGERYRRGQGLRVLIDAEEVGRSECIGRVRVDLLQGHR